MVATQIIFLITAAVTLGAALMVVSTRRLVHAALWLILTLAGVAVLFVLLDASFLAVVQVVIYIGAIAILLIFGVMLTRRVMHDTGPQVNRNWWLAAIISLVLFASLVAMFSMVSDLPTGAGSLPLDENQLLVDLGRSLVDVNRFVVPFEVASILLLAALIGAMMIARPLERGDRD
jgi:NADH-quinone oxidoreductase subunit J